MYVFCYAGMSLHRVRNVKLIAETVKVQKWKLKNWEHKWCVHMEQLIE